jgi:hypothetical protein
MIDPSELEGTVMTSTTAPNGEQSKPAATVHEQPKLPAATNGEESKEPRWMSYKSGSLDYGKLEIKEIIHKSLKGAIYLTAGDNLTWDEEENLGKHWYRATAEAINLLTPAKMTIEDPLERNRALKMLAAGLTRALQATAPDPDEDFLAPAREFILARRQEILQIRYFVASVKMFAVAAILLVLIITLVFNDDRSNAHQFLIAALLGSVGAIISVLQRFHAIPVELYTSRKFITINGWTRILLGVTFGSLFLLFHKAGMLFQFAEGRPLLLYGGAFVAGFSERAIPEVLTRFERQIVTRQTSQSRPGRRRRKS